MRYQIVDSHRNWTKNRINSLKTFFMVDKGLKEEEAYYQLSFANWYRREFSSICFEAIAYDAGAAVGYMRCYKDPASPERWFVGDIFVKAAYRQKKVASKLYDKVIDEVMEYEEARTIEASVAKSNQASIRLHESQGFVDTKEKRTFANFSFAQNESFFELRLLKYLPLDFTDETGVFLKDIWQQALRDNSSIKKSRYGSMKIDELMKEYMENETLIIETIWNGNNLVGISLEDEKEMLEFIMNC